jgi:hypothetical protein
VLATADSLDEDNRIVDNDRKRSVAEFSSYTAYGAGHTSPEPAVCSSVFDWTSFSGSDAGVCDDSAMLICV